MKSHTPRQNKSIFSGITINNILTINTKRRTDALDMKIFYIVLVCRALIRLHKNYRFYFRDGLDLLRSQQQ